MSDIEHLPVRPNIGVQKNIGRLRPIINDQNIFNNSLDPDVKRVISKNDNIDNESQVTKEERVTKGVKNLRDAEKKSKEETEPPKNQWSSWIIISLAVIIIVLIIIIIYYVIQYNTTLLDKTIIPEDVIRPTPHMTPQIQQVYHSIQPQPTQESTPVKPKNFVDPTKNDLSNALKELNKSKMDIIIEEDEPVEIKKPVEPAVKKQTIQQTEKIVELPDEDDEDKNEKLMEMHMNASLEDLIFNDESVEAFGENDEIFSTSDE
jgi:cytoskeletal protein RodZ